jgi:quercetin dioxygenase-like cupin family protein
LEILPKQPSVKGSPDRFTGDVWVDILAQGQGPSPMRVNVVRFAPGARNAWHAHALGQTLHITEGIGAFSRAAARSARFVPATRSTRLPASGTGTVLRLTIS